MTRIILPCKDFVRAKTRLAGVLAAHERRSLMQAMVEDVLTVIAGHPGISEVVLVSDDPAAALLAEKYCVRHLDESKFACRGLNGVVEATRAELKREGPGRLLVLHGDVPAITADEINMVIAIRPGSYADVVMVPDRNRLGTNGLLLDASRTFSFCYGENSFDLHRKQAPAACILELPGLSLDVDCPMDLLDLMSYLQKIPQLAPHSRQLLMGTSLGSRLQAVLASQFEQDIAGRGEY